MGDELADADAAPGEAHNYFALLDILPGDLLRRIVKDKGCCPTASKVASLLGVDLVNEILSSCIPAFSAKNRRGSTNSISVAAELDMVHRDAGGASLAQPAGIDGLKIRASADGAESLGEGSSRASNEARETLGYPKLESEFGNFGKGRSADGINGSGHGPDGCVMDQQRSSDTSTFAAIAFASEEEQPRPSLCDCTLCVAAYTSTLMASNLLNGKQNDALASSEEEFLLGVLHSGGPWDSSSGDGLTMERSLSVNSQPLQAGGLELDAADIDKALASRSNRLPGISNTEEHPGSMTLDLLEKLAAIAPLRAFLAAVIELFTRHNALCKGFLPILLEESSQADEASPGSGEGQAAPAQKSNEQKPALLLQDRHLAPVSDSQLREFVLTLSAEKFPVLQRWLLMQIDTLQDRQTGAISEYLNPP